MPIKVASSAGFCPGVSRAVEMAYDVAKTTKAYMLGPMVHNKIVVDELIDRGLKLVHTVEDIPSGATVLIRAHGVPPTILSVLKAKECTVIDRTCPYVARIHAIARQAQTEGAGLIIIGSPNHPEVIGIAGQTDGPTVILESLDTAKKVVLSDVPWFLVAQTTFSVEDFEQIVKFLERKIANLKLFDTICGTTASRQAEAAKLSEWADIMLVLGSRDSSNTRKLVQVCETRCARTYAIESLDRSRSFLMTLPSSELNIGITAGASTPERLIREVIQVMGENEVLKDQQDQTPDNVDQAVDSNDQITADHINQSADLPELPVVTGTEQEAVVEQPEESPEQQAEPVEQQVESVEQPEESSEQSAEPEEQQAAEVDQQDQMDVSFSDFIDSIPQLKRDTVVKGAIVRFDDENVYVDVRDKSEGRIPRREFDNDPDFDLEAAAEEHREIDVYVRNIRNTDMGKEILLSKAKVDFKA